MNQIGERRKFGRDEMWFYLYQMIYSNTFDCSKFENSRLKLRLLFDRRHTSSTLHAEKCAYRQKFLQISKKYHDSAYMRNGLDML